MSKVGFTDTKEENLCEDPNLMKFKSTPGIKPVIAVYVGKHATPMPPPLTQVETLTLEPRTILQKAENKEA